jgi:hypothetical protein
MCAQQHLSFWHTQSIARLLRGEDSMLVFVDIQKAYPSVWQDGLFYKLRRAVPHINGHLIELLKKSCITQGETRVFLQGLQSTPYTSCVGVCEGAVESPALFNYFINNSSGRPEGSRVRRHSDLCRLAGCTLCRRHHFWCVGQSSG